MNEDEQEVGVMKLTPIRLIGTYPIFSEESPSEEFMQAVTHVGSDCITCEFCGRLHFSSEYEAREEGDTPREELWERAEALPGGNVISHPEESSVSYGHLDDKQYVVNCLCNAGVLYEKLFYSHLSLIADYSKARAERMQGEANRISQLAESVVVPK